MRQWELGWLAILGILFTYELIAVFAANPSWPTLTRLTTSHVPAEVTMTLLTWLWLHFALRYWR